MSGKTLRLCVILFVCLTMSCSTLSMKHRIQYKELSIALNEKDLSDLAQWDSIRCCRNTASRGRVKLQKKSIVWYFHISTKKPSQKLNFSPKKEVNIPMVLEQEDVMPTCLQLHLTHPLVSFCPQALQ